MSVKNCTLPWSWLVLDEDGNSRPCCQATGTVGRLEDQSVEEIWNGSQMVKLRGDIKAGKIPEACAGSVCSFVQAQMKNSESADESPPKLEQEMAEQFDENYYLTNSPDVADAVARHQMQSGLDHFVNFGRKEGRPYRLLPKSDKRLVSDLHQALADFSSGQTTVSVTPKDLVIGVTTVCNLKCVMCPHGLGAIKSPRHLDISYAEKLEPFIARAHRVELVGIGEPMLAPLFWKIIEVAKKYPSAFLRANSNGHFLNEINIERLVDSTFSELSISLDAATPETYRKIRGSNLEGVTEKIRALCKRRREKNNSRLDITLNFILMRTNIHEIVQFAEMAADLGATTVVYSQLSAMAGSDKWTVNKPNWTFVYSEEMLPENDPEARRQLIIARDRCVLLGLKSHFIMGTALRMNP
jgi:MoaA/NifB/PqqE/SkfB family radical SAM enzyme